MRKISALAAIAYYAASLPAQQGSAEFNKRLNGDQEILQALNRLTFGPRLGDIEAVKQMGLSKWIDLQLHPERIPENEALETLTKSLVEPTGPAQGALVNAQARLKTLQTRAAARALRPEDIIPSEQVRKLRAENAKQNLEFLSTLPEEKEVQILAVMPAIRTRVLPMLDPELQKKVVAASIGQPPRLVKVVPLASASELITTQQQMLLRTGSDKEGLDFLATLPQEKAVQVLAQMPAVRQRLLPLLDPDLRKKVEAAVPGPKQPGQILAQAKLFRALESDRQLEEVLADFWYNHFNVDAGKGAGRYMVTSYDRETIRPHVLGKFRDLLAATANSPAMMFYLDNWQSSVPMPANPNRPNQQAKGLNENYARELMELHTLGVSGGYTQKDVTEVARCFTGWTINQPQQSGTFEYNDRMHDHGEKIVLGVTIPAGGGKEDGEKVLDILARHPSTARFVSRELAQRFVADDPPQALVDRMAKTFHDTDGDIRAVLTTLFESREFFSEGAYRAKIKSPFEMIVSALRATGATVDQALPLVKQISALGEPLYRKLEPTGYSNVGTDWMSTAGLMARMNFSLDLMQDNMDGVNVDAAKFSAVPATAAHQVLFTDAQPQTLEAIDKALAAEAEEHKTADGALVAGMLLGSPDFQRK